MCESNRIRESAARRNSRPLAADLAMPPPTNGSTPTFRMIGCVSHLPPACHRPLVLEAQVALTLRTAGGPRHEEIARAFRRPQATDGAKARAGEAEDSDAGHPLRVVPKRARCPSGSTRAHRLYLVFTDAMSATRAASMLSNRSLRRAIRLAASVRALTTLILQPRRPGSCRSCVCTTRVRRAYRRGGQTSSYSTTGSRRLNRRADLGIITLVDQRCSERPWTLLLASHPSRGGTAQPRERRTPTGRRNPAALRRLGGSPAIVPLNRAGVARRDVRRPAAALAIVDEPREDARSTTTFDARRSRRLLSDSLGALAQARRANHLRALECVGNDQRRRFLARRLRDMRERCPPKGVQSVPLMCGDGIEAGARPWRCLLSRKNSEDLVEYLVHTPGRTPSSGVGRVATMPLDLDGRQNSRALRASPQSIYPLG